MATLFQSHDPNAGFHAAQRAQVSVNGVKITSREIAREVQQHAASTPLDAWSEAARSLALRELMLQEARRLELVPNPLEDDRGRRETDEDALIRQLIENEVETPEPDEMACRHYYQQNTGRFRSADIYEAAHILLGAEPEQEDPLANARAAAARLLEILRREPQRFAAFARAYSTCPSREVDGNLGQIGEGDTTPAFAEALAALSPGEMTNEPVVTPYGIHIIRLDRKIEGRVLPFEVLHDRIAAYLIERSERWATAQYLARLAASAEIIGVEMPKPHEVGVF